MNATLIVSIIGVIAVLGINFKGKLSGFLKGKKQEHSKDQNEIKKEIDETKKEIEEKDKKIKDLEEKSKKAEKIIDKISEEGNEEVDKISKSEDMDKLIKEFKEW